MSSLNIAFVSCCNYLKNKCKYYGTFNKLLSDTKQKSKRRIFNNLTLCEPTYLKIFFFFWIYMKLGIAIEINIA